MAQHRPHRKRQAYGQHQGDQLGQRHEQARDLEAVLAVARFELAEIGGPDGLNQGLDEAGQAEGHQQRIERRDREARHRGMQARADREEQRHDHDQREQRVHAHRRHLVAQVGGEERECEVRQVDQPQQPPRQAQAEPEQAVEGADEDARENALRQQAGTRQCEAGHGALRRPAAWRRRM
jgi:hypothetical protein